MTISIIVAIADNYAIGFNNRLLFRLPDDMKRFKKITTGHTVIMGRNTFLSLPKGALPDRVNIVITDKPDEKFNDCIMAYSLEDALNKCPINETECFIIGGGIVYKQFFEKADRLYITKVHETAAGDTFFPLINEKEWDAISVEDFFENEPPYSYIIYHKKK